MSAEDLFRIITLTDLTTLDSLDTEEKIRDLCLQAIHPLGASDDLPSCAAVCVWPVFAPLAKELLEGSEVQLACVAAGFPYAQSPLTAKIAEIHYAVDHGADEIDICINRGDFLAGKFEQIHDEIAALKEACSGAHLKVIIEECELPNLDAIAQACNLAIQAGADFIKTSTGKGSAGASLPVVRLMLDLALKHREKTGRLVGVKAAGGIRTCDEALEYLAIADRAYGSALPSNFRFGASSLLEDIRKNLSNTDEG